MKTVIVALCCCICIQLFAQKNDLCFITTITGSAKKPDSTKLSAGDTIHCSMLKQLTLNPRSTVLELLSPSGPFAYPLVNEKDENIFTGIAEILRMKSTNIQLSSRGGCDEVMEDCLKTDPKVNDKILLIDSLSLPLVNIEKGEQVKYFLQWKHEGDIYNNKLNIINNKLLITRADLIFSGIRYNDSEAVKLGMVKYNAAGKSYSELASFKLCFITSQELKNYYNALSVLLPEEAPQALFERFYKELYVFYGKPDLCILKSMIHYTK